MTPAETDDSDYTALIEEFRSSGQLPVLWHWSARDLICGANVLHERYERLRNTQDYQLSPPGNHTSLVPIFLLYGLGLENLLKGLLVAQGVDATSTGVLNNHLKTHDVLRLWRDAGLSLSDDGRDEEVLRNLHFSIETGKYPVGKKPDPKAPNPIFLQLTSVERICALVQKADDALRAARPKDVLGPLKLCSLGLGL